MNSKIRSRGRRLLLELQHTYDVYAADRAFLHVPRARRQRHAAGTAQTEVLAGEDDGVPLARQADDAQVVLREGGGPRTVIACSSSPMAISFAVRFARSLASEESDPRVHPTTSGTCIPPILP